MGEFVVGKAILGFLLFVTSVFMMLLILVQRGKGGGLTGALGGMGGQSAFGSKAGDTFTRITIVTAIIWITLCMLTIAIYNPPPRSEKTADGGPSTGATRDQDGGDSTGAGASDASQPDSDATATGPATTDDRTAPDEGANATGNDNQDATEPPTTGEGEPTSSAEEEGPTGAPGDSGESSSDNG